MARDPKEAVYDLLEKYLTFLPFDEKLDYLAQFIRTGRFQRVTNPTRPEESFAFGHALEKAVPSLTRADSELVAKRLLRRFTQVEIDSTTARRTTEAIPKHRNRQSAEAEPELVKFVIRGDGKPLLASELEEFLSLFGDIYTLAADIPEGQFNDKEDSEHYAMILGATVDGQIDREPSEPLVIERIRKGSPLTIWFGGLMTLVVVAAVLSGGKVKIPGGFSFELKAVGDGIKKLREALAHQPALAKRVAAKKVKRLPPTS
jgi:hypothetical protein